MSDRSSVVGSCTRVSSGMLGIHRIDRQEIASGSDRDHRNPRVPCDGLPVQTPRDRDRQISLTDVARHLNAIAGVRLLLEVEGCDIGNNWEAEEKNKKKLATVNI